MKAEYKNIDEQIELLKVKNVLIKNEEKAKRVLLKENYYNLIDGYKDIFIDIKKSKKTGIETCDEETFFEEIYAVYKFDRDLRNLMFSYISIIETNIKSYISYVFSKKYGVKDYLKEKNFNVNSRNRKDFIKLVKIIKENVARNLRNYPEIEQCYKENGDIPFWMLDTLITFGAIVKFYIFLKSEEKAEVSNILNMESKEAQACLKILNIVRNISAHNNVLFNIKFTINYENQNNNRYYEILGIDKKDGIYKSGKNDIMAVIIILRRFLDDKEYIHFAHELVNMLDEVKEDLDQESFQGLLDDMGIPISYNKIEIL